MARRSGDGAIVCNEPRLLIAASTRLAYVLANAHDSNKCHASVSQRNSTASRSQKALATAMPQQHVPPKCSQCNIATKVNQLIASATSQRHLSPKHWPVQHHNNRCHPEANAPQGQVTQVKANATPKQKNDHQASTSGTPQRQGSSKCEAVQHQRNKCPPNVVSATPK